MQGAESQPVTHAYKHTQPKESLQPILRDSSYSDESRSQEYIPTDSGSDVAMSLI